VRVGDTRRPQGLFGSTVAAKAVVAAADLERTILYGEIVFSESGEWVVPTLLLRSGGSTSQP